MGHRIFISYRRVDSIHESGRIYDRLVAALGEDVVFRDVDAIPLGVDFRKVLDEEVSVSNILLAIIGDSWLTVKDEHGNRRLENPNDFVRIEIESAIKRGIHIIPVFVGRSTGLPTDDLPESLHMLSFFNGTPVRPDPDFHKDVDKLIRAVGHIFNEIDERQLANSAALQTLESEHTALYARVDKIDGLNASEKGQRTKLLKRMQVEKNKVTTLLVDEPALGRELDFTVHQQALDTLEEDILELEVKVEERHGVEQRERATQAERDAERKREEQVAADRLAVEQAAAADHLAAEQATAEKSEADAKRQRAQRKDQNESSLRGLIDDTEALQHKLTTLSNLNDTESEEKASIAARLVTLLGEFIALLADEDGLSAELETSDFQQRIDRLTQAITTLQEERRARLQIEKEEDERQQREQREAERIRKSLTRQREDMQAMLGLLNGGIGLDGLEEITREDGKNLVERVQALVTQIDDALEALPPRIEDNATINDYQDALSDLRLEVQTWHKEVRATQPRNWTWAYIVGGIAAVALLAWGATQSDFSGAEPDATREVLLEPSATVNVTFDEMPASTPESIEGWQEVDRFYERGVINDIVLSPDEDMLAVASSTGLWLYEYPAMKLVQSRDDDGGYYSVAWSPDSSKVVLGGYDSQVWIWDVSLGQEIKIFGTTQHSSSVFSVDWSPDGRWIASGDDNGRLYLWDADTGEVEYRLSGHSDKIWDVEFSSDPDLLASASEDKTVHIWDLTSGEVITVFEQHIYPVYALAWSPDGARLASADSNLSNERNSGFYVWNAVTGVIELAKVNIHVWGIYDLEWSPDGNTIATAGIEWVVGIWDVNSDQELGWYNHNGSVYAMDWSTLENGWILTATQSGDINYINLDLNAPSTILSEHASNLNSFAISPDESQYLLTRHDSVLSVVEIATGELSFSLVGHTANVWDAAWSYNNSMIATAGGWEDYTVRIWDAKDGAEIAVLDGHTNELNALSWSPDNTKIASAGVDGTVRIWDIETAREIVTLDGHQGNEIRSVAWSPDGQWVASGANGLLNIWNIDTLSIEMTLRGYTGSVLALAWSPDGKYLASGGDQGESYIWNIASGGKLTRTLERGWTNALAWSPDGNYLALAGGDNDIYIWKTSPWHEIGTLSGHTDGIYDLFWAFDSTLLYSGSWDGTVRIWQLIE